MGLVYFTLTVAAAYAGGLWWQFAIALTAASVIEIVYRLFTDVADSYDVISREEAAAIYDIEEWKREKSAQEDA